MYICNLGWQHIRLASYLLQHSFWSGKDMAIWEWVLRPTVGDPTLRVTKNLEVADAPP